MSPLDQIVRDAALAAGFDLCGIAPARNFPELAAFPAWLAEGRGGEMRYLAARDEFGRLKRESLAHAAPWARSVVVCAMNYNTAAPSSLDPHPEGTGWISRYAWGERDYHDVILPKLREVETALLAACAEPPRTWCYVDTGPVIERVFANYSGIGWQAKNTCIINQELGSWLFLGVILTSLELAPSLPAADRCGTCTRCIEACPTQAITAPYQLDASKCISYLTIEKRGAIPEELREGMARHVFGCDICQDVCPWNRRAPATSAPEFQPREGFINADLAELATISEDEFRSRFRGSPVKRAKRTGIRRNAVVALGNSGNPRHLPLLGRLSKDDDETVAEHARWAAGKLRGNNRAGETPA